MRSAAAVLVGALFLSASSFALRTRAGVTNTQMLNNANAFQFVGVLEYNDSGTTGDRRSANLIGDKFILTAGHNLPGAGQTAVFKVGGQTYSCSNWIRHPNYNFDNLDNGYDVCVARLDRRVTNIAPTSLYSGTDERFKPCWVTGAGGYGSTGGSVNFDWLVRAGTNVVDIDSTLPNVLLTDLDNPNNNAADNSLSFIGSVANCSAFESIPWYGDSGAGLYIEQGGKMKVAGLTSGVFNIDSTLDGSYGDCGEYTRINVGTLPAWILDKAWENGRVQGTISFQDYIGDSVDLPLKIELTAPGSGTVLETQKILIGPNGQFSFVTSRRGLTDVYFKADHWLRKRVMNINIQNNTPIISGAISVMNGDVDNDNEVGLGDFGMLSASFGTFHGDPGYMHEADLDGDHEVGLSDFGILSARFGDLGD